MVKLKLSQPRCMAPEEQSHTTTAQAPTIASSTAPTTIPTPSPAPGALAIPSTAAPATIPAPLLALSSKPIAENKPTPAINEERRAPPPPPTAPRSRSLTIVQGLSTPPTQFEPNLRQAAWQNGLSSLSELCKTNPMAWYTLVGLYFLESGRRPNQVANGNRARKLAEYWRKDLLRLDNRDHNPSIDDGRWRLDSADRVVIYIGSQVAHDQFKCQIFEEGIRLWACQPENDKIVAAVLEKADWTQSNFVRSPEWMIMDNILKMGEGEEKDNLLRQAEREAPRVYAACLDHVWCGVRKFVKENQSAGDPSTTQRRTTPLYNHRKRGSSQFEDLSTSESRRKRQAMNGSFGRPTQIHGVPLEERAVDSKGNRLPWGLEWHEDHPNARGQKRHMEEKGPFGKSNRRKGSSRTRTATPAKKENPTLDGFEKALSYTLTQEAQLQQGTPTSRMQNEGNLTSQHNISVNKQPTQVMIYGYSSESQWAALDFYEKCSYGMICEDYARDPPAAAKRYPTTFSSPHARRPLTKAEKAMVFKYSGGESWVKVTFDSTEAAERAIERSPIQIYGHWVYAQLYRGIGPEHDEPIPIQEGERGLRQPRQKPQTTGVSYAQQGNVQQDGAATLPKPLAPSTPTPADQSNDTSPSSSSTVTSGTATGVEYPDLRQRNVPQTTQSDQPSPAEGNPRMMRHFPDTPRTVLRPASEAFLPQLTWWERQLRWLSEMGLVPGEVIGNGIPRTADGRVDLARASFYWRFFYWIDSYFGTDFCGLRDD